MSRNIHEEVLESALALRSIVAVIDGFFLDPNPENEMKALEQIGKLPGTLRLYGALCRLLAQRCSQAA